MKRLLTSLGLALFLGSAVFTGLSIEPSTAEAQCVHCGFCGPPIHECCLPGGDENDGEWCEFPDGRHCVEMGDCIGF
jgi:hypothetical protein